MRDPDGGELVISIVTPYHVWSIDWGNTKSRANTSSSTGTSSTNTRQPRVSKDKLPASKRRKTSNKSSTTPTRSSPRLSGKANLTSYTIWSGLQSLTRIDKLKLKTGI